MPGFKSEAEEEKQILCKDLDEFLTCRQIQIFMGGTNFKSVLCNMR